MTRSSKTAAMKPWRFCDLRDDYMDFAAKKSRGTLQLVSR
jgi:hypothetical protein